MRQIFELIDSNDLVFGSIFLAWGLICILLLVLDWPRRKKIPESLPKEKQEWKICPACGAVVNYLTPSLILEGGVCEECANEENDFFKQQKIQTS